MSLFCNDAWTAIKRTPDDIIYLKNNLDHDIVQHEQVARSEAGGQGVSACDHLSCVDTRRCVHEHARACEQCDT